MKHDLSTSHTRGFGFLLALLTIIVILLLPGVAPRARAQNIIDARIDPALADALAAAAPLTPLEVVIVFDDTALAGDVAALATTFYQMQELPMAGAVLTAAAVETIADWPGIYSLTLNAPLDTFVHESVAYTGADQVWTQYGQTGGNTTVAVLDSGIDATHPDLLLGYKTIENVKVLPFEPAIEGVPNSDTSSGHGTHVAGTIGGLGIISEGYYRGMAPDVNLVGVGAGEALFILTAVQGYDWILANADEYGIRVISNSWGSSGGDLNVRNPVVQASYIAYQRGILSVFAAGNDGGYDILNPYSLAPWVLSVAAHDKDGVLADFSSRGKEGDLYKHPDIAAPGVDIYAARCSCIGVTATDPFPNPVNPAWTASYTALSGTSMATPHVSGAAALLFSAKPTLSPDQVIDLLTQNVTPTPQYALWEAGHGQLNTLAAFEASLAVTGNLSAFLDGDRDYSIEDILMVTDQTTYTTTTYTGYTAVGMTTMPPNEYPVTVADNTIFFAVDLTWDPQTLDAYDLEIADADGNIVASSGNSVGEPESALYITTGAGDYTVRVVPFAGVNATYTLAITLAANP